MRVMVLWLFMKVVIAAGCSYQLEQLLIVLVTIFNL